MVDLYIYMVHTEYELLIFHRGVGGGNKIRNKVSEIMILNIIV